MNVLIAGGSGFIGRALVKQLLERGDEVVVLSRTPEKVRTRPGLRAVGWDGRTASGWVSQVEEADAIVNLVGENLGGGLWTKARRDRILSSRVNAGQAIVEAVRQANRKPGVLIQMSGIGFYGFCGENVVDEDASRGDDFLARVSEKWENASREVEDMGVRRAVTRNGLILDDREGIFPLVLLPYRLFVGGPLGSGKQWFPWAHLEDAVRAILFLMDNEETSGVYNLVTPEPVRIEEVGRAVGKVMRRPHWFRVPGWAMKLVLGQMSTLVLEGQRALPRRLLEAGFKFKYPEIEIALREMMKK